MFLQPKSIRLIVIIFICLLLVTFVLLWFSSKKKEPVLPVQLYFWGVFDDSDIYEDFIREFRLKHPDVSIEYKKFDYLEYESELLDALNKKIGPDIFFIHNAGLWRYMNFISPAPRNLISSDYVQKNYAPVVTKDFVRDNEVYSLPLYVSTPALFYNKKLFTKNFIVSPPYTWEEFIKQTEVLKRIDENGNILTAGAAMGTAQNINRAVDILYLLMLQSGTIFYADNGRAVFAQDIIIDNKTFNPAEQALKFYTDFANPKKKVYTYNNTLDYSIDLFTKDRLGMMFNYNWHIRTIRTKNPLLDFGIAPIPQPKVSKNQKAFANYWSLVVNKNSAFKNIAWEFISFLSQPENLKRYLQKTSNPTPRKDLISWQIENMPELAVFASQIIIADSFPRYDDVAYEKVFNKMIDDVVYEYYSPKTALQNAQNEINKIISR